MNKQYENEFLEEQAAGSDEIICNIANGIGELYFAIYHIWVEDHSYVCYKEKLNGILSDIGARGDYIPAWKIYIDRYVVEEDQEALGQFADFSTLAERLKNKKSISHIYRRKDIGWTRGQFIAAKRDDQGNVKTIIFAVSDINEEMENKIQKEQAQLETLHDPMTGLLNRKAFETYKNLEAYQNKPVGIMLIDIDRFKNINDRLGHLKGDQVLKRIADMLSVVTRNSDCVFRFGGDEFVIFLYDCKISIWKQMCQKIYSIHRDLAKAFADEATVTLSSGICIAQNGFSHEAFLRADEALYHTKNNGRAGCTMISEEGYIIKEWYDDQYVQIQQEVFRDQKVVSDEIRTVLEELYFSNFHMNFKSALVTSEQFQTYIAEILNGITEAVMALVGENKKALSIGHFNLTKNIYKNVGCEEKMNQFIDETKSFEEIMAGAAEAVVGEETRREYRRRFDRKNLLRLAEMGQMHVELKHLLRFSENHMEWVISAFDMVRNPITEEISGVCYSKSVQKNWMAELHLKKMLQQDYMMAAVAVADTDEFYLFDADRGTYGEVQHGFWNAFQRELHSVLLNTSKEDFKNRFSKEAVLTKLEKQSELIWVCDSDVRDDVSRLEYKFSYLDSDHHFLMASIRNITDAFLLKKYRHDSEHDPLTDLYNRRTTFKKIRQLLDEHPEDQFVIVHMDMKHFHLYNTFFGDEVGDKLLCDVADQFRWMNEDYEYWVYGRIEADVFCAFFPYEEQKFTMHLERTLNMLKNYRDDFLIEPTLGLYFVTDRNMSIESMFSRATIAAKTVQPETPNATKVYNDKMERMILREQQIVNEMQTALLEEQFQVYYQPKYSLRTSQVVGAEALVRWGHPEKGVILPTYFIPIFEKNGFISILDRYIWERVCMRLNKWREEGKNIIPISVNVSRISMFNPTTVQFLKDLIIKYNIDPQYLEIELTESAYADNPEEMKKQMNELRKAGFKILMDDFGSGYSSLNTLRELPVDCLKLDMCFLSKEKADEREQTVLSSIINMSKQLSLPVIAEGVERQDQAEFLRSIGCDYVQGFLYQRPMPADEFEEQHL